MGIRAITLAVLALATAPVVAAEQRFGARLSEAGWEVNSSRMLCTLSHAIPGYGTAVFQAAAGEAVTFNMRVDRKSLHDAVARVSSQPPAWMHDAAMRDLGQVPVSQGNIPFKLRQLMARRLIAELENGRFPTFTYRDWADGRDRVTVSLSAVHFRRGLGEFLACVRNLLPHRYDDVSASRLQFSAGTDLAAGARRRLDQIAEYLLADNTVREVLLRGGTDSRGYRYLNRKVGEQRAKIVRDYLVSRGVRPNLFRIESVGETEPVASNRTEEGRRRNRRVEVVMRR